MTEDGTTDRSWLKKMAEAYEFVISKLPKGPHIVAASAHPNDKRGEPAVIDEVLAWCGGPGLCKACDEGRGVLIVEALAWKEMTGWMSALAFGRHGHAKCSEATYEELALVITHGHAKCSEATYEELRLSCTAGTVTNIYHDPLLGRGLNSFSVHVADGVPDGFLVKCNDCNKESKDGK